MMAFLGGGKEREARAGSFEPVVVDAFRQGEIAGRERTDDDEECHDEAGGGGDEGVQFNVLA